MTDEEALEILAHPCTTEYQDIYTDLRHLGVDIHTALWMILEMRTAELAAKIAEFQAREEVSIE